MFTITKEFAFSASHQLHGLPDGHQCGRLHGHNYVVEVELQARTVDDTGFVLDYGALAPFKDWLDATYDHRHLNDFLTQPTAEVMAEALHGVATELLGRAYGHNVPWRVSAVRVRETPKTCAEYRP